VRTAEFFAMHSVFSLDEAAKALAPPGGRSGTVERLKHYLEKRQLKLVTRRIYAVVSPGLKADQYRPDPFLIAAAVRPDSVFSHHSALELLGAAHSIWNQCAVYTGKRRRRLQLEGATILFLEHPFSMREGTSGNLATQRIERRGRLLEVTTPERTLVEGFRRPALAGGLEELVRSAGGFPTLDLDLLEEVLRRYDMAYLWAAVGWFLERFRQSLHVPDEVIRQMEQRRPRSPQYLERKSRGGMFVPRWNLILPKVLSRLGEPDEP
jgi:predicted transcriptional regulator of viral defense system